MSNRFGQFDGAIHRVDVSHLNFDSALLLAIRAVHAPEFLECDFASPFALDGSAEFLTELVSGDFDFIKVGHPVALLDCLQLSRDARRFFQVKFEFFVQLPYFRVHAIVPQKIPRP